MEKNTNTKVTNKKQFERMLFLLEQHPDIARGLGRFGSSKQTTHEQWNKFSVELNSLGPPCRSSTEWQRVWIHYKGNLKRKMANNRNNILATSGGPSQEISLSQLEQSAASLLQLQTNITPPGQTCGFITHEENNINILNVSNVDRHDSDTDIIEPQPSTSTQPPKPKKKKTLEEERLDVIHVQTQNQEDMIETLQQIHKTCLKNYDINKKLYDLKKEKLEIYKEQHKFDVELKKLKIESLKSQLILNDN